MIRFRCALCIASLMTLCAVPASGQIFRWTDAEGRLHFTERIEQVPPQHRVEAWRNRRSHASRGATSYSGPGPSDAASEVPAAQAPSPSRRYGSEIRIPFRRDGSLMRVHATVNDTVEVPFLIDTGASGVSIPSHYAEQLGVRIRPDTPVVAIQTANGVTARPVITLRAVQVGGARVENLSATVNPSMEIGLLGGSFFNNYIYRVDAAQSVMTLQPNENIRGGLGPEQWRERFRALTDPLERLEKYVLDNPKLHDGERAVLAARRVELETGLQELQREADRLDVPQIWRH